MLEVVCAASHVEPVIAQFLFRGSTYVSVDLKHIVSVVRYKDNDIVELGTRRFCSRTHVQNCSYTPSIAFFMSVSPKDRVACLEAARSLFLLFLFTCLS